MAKINYTLCGDDSPVYKNMRLKDDPGLVILHLNNVKSEAQIKHTFTREQLGELQPLDMFKKLCHNTEADEELHYQTKSCIAVMSLNTKQKQSGAALTRLIVCKWVPDYAKGKEKMIFTTAWNVLKEELNSKDVNISTNQMFEASDWDDVKEKSDAL